ncbi:NUDIX hydrolase [Metallosphaera sedula]|uniref:NUDIX hydrolase n=3 Tax=Metallosphaera TaxID=41980 RepID=A4YEP7_METS5|nr:MULTISPECIES: NUDIX hydrolase [Metallosphaera]ABP94899.1 NUDIX hydrolase [Metallosphaera sedula DSM 5348]AIM26886.1 NUDIX hydrolase [Metallosphaera sedula]AKV73824.1 NUDIX hydrolase [Metallosphaera sedula]AKV76065.1 NUDIX hydrolase [Metallosphaera sedula]AKV78316.1 NUDIX hydrolase [Metallosphaera sedula]
MRIFSGKKFEVYVEKVPLPNGRERQLEYIKHRGSVVLLPLLEDKIVMIYQYRPVIGKWIYELPAGSVEEGEDPLSTAKRELVEETGYEAESITEVMSFYPSPGITTEVMRLYLARDLRYVGAKPEDYEVIEVRPMEFSQVEKLMNEGAIQDAKTLIGIYYLKSKGILGP